MSNLPRLAVGTVQATADPLPVLLALEQLLERQSLQMQLFHAQAGLVETDPRTGNWGRPVRYLDSWLMRPEICRESFVHGSDDCDVSIVVGRFDTRDALRGGTLEELCDWLDLPRLVVIDASQLSLCQLPERPSGVVGLLLDRAAPQDVADLQTRLESLWGVPVLGTLPEMVASQSGLVDDASAECGRGIFGNCLQGSICVSQIMRLAARRDLPIPPRQLFFPGKKLAGLVVAVAYDEAFPCYFPSVLDLFELQGATVQDFSPLRDESLPRGTDWVYIGGGALDRYANQLAKNHCLTVALRNHVRQNLPVYAEGDGLAYLCGHIRLTTGQLCPMVNIFPAIAVQREGRQLSKAVEIALVRDQWLAPAGTILRGYQNPKWSLEPAGPLVSYVAQQGHKLDLVGCRAAIGSRLHLNFAAQFDFLRCFFPASEGSYHHSAS